VVGKGITENKAKTNKQTKEVLWGDREKYGSIWIVYDPHYF
jgi:hypothetical protein